MRRLTTLALILLPTICAGCSAVTSVSSGFPFATLAAGDAYEPEIAGWLRAGGVRVEKDANGDVRIFDSLACRLILVRYRRAMRVRLDTIAENIANINATHDANGKNIPFARKIVVADQTGSIQFKTDPSPFLMRFDPGNPDADAKGYVHYPNVDRAVEYANALAASRDYETAVAILPKFDPSYVEVVPEEPRSLDSIRSSSTAP